MRNFPLLSCRFLCTRLVQLGLLGLCSLAMPSRADVYDEVERMIRNGQLERASHASAQRLSQSPQDPQMRLLKSRILDAQGQVDEALAVLQSLTLEFPELPEPHNNLAVLYARRGRTPEALESLNKALLARPDYAVALENLGDLHLSLALQAYQRAALVPGAAPSVIRKTDALTPLLKR